MIILLLLIIVSYGHSIYNENLTKTALNISQSAYCMNFITPEWNCKTCDNDNIYEGSLLINGEQIIFGYNTKYNVIFTGFRGSSNIKNWIDNFHFKLIYPYSNNTEIGIENGFYNLYDSLKNEIYNKLNELSIKYKTKDLLITGHSSGGAIATTMTFDILYDTNYNMNYLITFGSPRVGNEEFVKQFNKYNIYSNRITHYYDMVPHVPPEKINYLHISQEIWYNEDNTNYIICNDTNNIEDNKCSDSCAPFKCISTSDHLNYLNISMGGDGIC